MVDSLDSVELFSEWIVQVQFEDVEDKAQEGVNKVEMGFGATYSQYLQVSVGFSRQMRSLS